jgi:hypothetical protein
MLKILAEYDGDTSLVKSMDFSRRFATMYLSCNQRAQVDELEMIKLRKGRTIYQKMAAERGTLSTILLRNSNQ